MAPAFSFSIVWVFPCGSGFALQSFCSCVAKRISAAILNAGLEEKTANPYSATKPKLTFVKISYAFCKSNWIMKNLLVLIVFMLLQNIHSQTMNDTIFKDVILINGESVITNGFDFLIDIPIKVQDDPIIIFNNDERISSKLFFDRESFLYQQDEIILITPDWEYHKNIIEAQKESGIHVEPLAQNKFYHIDRKSGKIDSITAILNHPKSIKIDFKKEKTKETKMLVFYQECFGSSCCPRDFRRDLLANGTIKGLSRHIETFEKDNKVKVVGLKKQILGKEGEHCKYLTIENLQHEQKVIVLNLLKYISTLEHPKDGAQFPKVFVPHVINRFN